MPTEFQMPKLGLTMTEGTILEWVVPSGTTVADGTVVMRVETDKVETDIEVVGSGVLHHVAGVGDTIECGGLVAFLLADGEAPPTPPAPPTPTTAPAAAPVAQSAPPPAAAPSVPAASLGEGGRLLASPFARTLAVDLGVDLRAVRGTGPGGRIVAADVEAAAQAPLHSAAMPSAAPAAERRTVQGGAVFPATTAARQLADLLGIDLAEIAPDGDGRVSRDGVARHVRGLLAAAARSSSSTPSARTGAVPSSDAPLLQTPSSTVRMSGMRGTIAKRMHASLQEMAQLTLTMDADVSAILADQQARGGQGVAPGFTAYVVAAAARALRLHPAMNAQVVGNEIALLPDVHVGLAVALESGLMVPVIRHADRLDLVTTGAEAARLAGAARNGSLSVDEATGGTFSVTALGMYGVDAFTPVINPPNAGILGVGRIREELTLVDGQVGAARRLTLSLTWDHRVLDGAPAAAFCRTVADLLSDPSSLNAVT